MFCIYLSSCVLIPQPRRKVSERYIVTCMPAIYERESTTLVLSRLSYPAIPFLSLSPMKRLSTSFFRQCPWRTCVGFRIPQRASLRRDDGYLHEYAQICLDAAFAAAWWFVVFVVMLQLTCLYYAHRRQLSQSRVVVLFVLQREVFSCLRCTKDIRW